MVAGRCRDARYATAGAPDLQVGIAASFGGSNLAAHAPTKHAHRLAPMKGQVPWISNSSQPRDRSSVAMCGLGIFSSVTTRRRIPLEQGRATVSGMVRRPAEILGALGDLDALGAGRDVSRCGAEG